MLLGLLGRIITAVLVFVGFLTAVAWVVLGVTGHKSLFDRLPISVAIFLLVSVVCFGVWDVIWKKPKDGASREKPPKI